MEMSPGVPYTKELLEDLLKDEIEHCEEAEVVIDTLLAKCNSYAACCKCSAMEKQLTHAAQIIDSLSTQFGRRFLPCADAGNWCPN